MPCASQILLLAYCSTTISSHLHLHKISTPNIIMGGLPRSKPSCWTCRLRKKKCDESCPQCLTSESSSITSYGYGLKPDWMDNSDMEKAVANNLQQIVKYTSRRKPAAHSSARRKPIIKLTPKSSNNSFMSPASRPQPIVGSVFSISAEESVLLMHFLDTVFPLQYPMYKPEIFVGGRGWLLALLFRTKPLYHVALALSLYHRRMTIFAKISHPCSIAAVVQQEKHIEICLTEFQQTMKLVNQFVQKNPHEDGLGTVTSIVRLVFLEVFFRLLENFQLLH